MELPLFVIVAVSVLVLPTCTFPKLKLDDETLSVCAAAVPVPVSGIAICAGDPFVASVIDPLADVAETGVNTASKFSDPPAGIVLEVLRPEMLNPEPLTLTCENDNVTLPVFLIVTTAELLLPTTTLPNATLAGFTEPRASNPVPLSPIDTVEPGALLVIVTSPVRLPADCGANCNCTATLWPAPMVPVKFPPTTLNPVPETVTPAIDTGAVPVSVSVRLCVALVPTGTLPKFSVLVLAERIPALAPFCDVVPAAFVVYPAQLERPIAAAIVAIIAIVARN